MKEDKNVETPANCPDHQNCIYRIEMLEKWKEAVEKKFDRLTNLLVANLTGVILTLIAIIGGLLVYMVE